MGSFGEYFLFYGLAELYIYIYIYIYIWLWLEGISSTCPRFFPLSSPRVSVRDSPHLFTATSLFKIDFLFPLFLLTEKGATSASGFWPIISLFLPFPGHRVQTSVGFHSVGDLFGLLSLSPEWGYRVQIAWPIFVFLPSTAGRSWPTFFISLFTVNHWRPANSNTEGSRNSLFLFSQ